jgi:hypothetical protein
MQFNRDHKPFTLSSCEKNQIKREDDIQKEFQKYKDMIKGFASKEPNEVEEYWNQLKDEWDLGQASNIYRCE